MRRQERPPSIAVPERLCRYIRSEWPGEGPFRQWTRARVEFIKIHGHETPLGDLIEVLSEHRRLIRLGMADYEPGPYRDGTP